MSAINRITQPGPPRTDFNTYFVLDRAIIDLADRRFMNVVEPRLQLHLLASLAAQAETWVTEQVAVARDSGVTWRDIGALLGLGAAVARQRYAPPTKPGARRASSSSAMARGHNRSQQDVAPLDR
jgi:hypothetical protein